MILSSSQFMRTQVEFLSAAFPKYPNEDAELVNSNCWGKRLAEFIRDSLPQHGIDTKDILCEDWGWLVNVKHEPFPLWIGCGIMDEFSEDDVDDNLKDTLPRQSSSSTEALTQFSVFITAQPGFFRNLFKKVDTKPAVQKVVSALEKLISESPTFRNVHWVE